MKSVPVGYRSGELLVTEICDKKTIVTLCERCGNSSKRNIHCFLDKNPVVCRVCSLREKRSKLKIGDMCQTLRCESFFWDILSNNKKVKKCNCVCIECGFTKITRAETFFKSQVSCKKCRKNPKFAIAPLRNRSPKRYWSNIMSNAKARKLPVLITLDDVLTLLDKQDHKCSLSGLPISILDGTASLDRIRNLEGYTLDNIQWIHRVINYMKHELVESEFLFFCEAITKQQQRKSSPSSLLESVVLSSGENPSLYSSVPHQ